MKQTTQWLALAWMAVGLLFFLAYMLGLDDNVKNAILGVSFLLFGNVVFQQWDNADRNIRVRKELRELRNQTDMLLKHAGLAYDPKAHVPAGVLDRGPDQRGQGVGRHVLP